MTLPVSPPVVPASCLVGPSRVVAVACVAWLLLIGACDAADDAPVDGAITADAGQRVDGGETPETAPDAGVLVDAGGLLPPLPARVSLAGGWPGGYLPVSTPRANGL